MKHLLTLGLVFALTGVVAFQASAADAERLDTSRLQHGAPAFPLIWRPYRPVRLPPVDLQNGQRLARLIVNGALELSLRDFLQLVVENNLDLAAARYDSAIAEVDLLRAESGQAARGTASSPLPAALFAGAIGAGVSSTAALSAGGTGGAAISSQGKLVTIGPRGNFDPTLSMNLSYDRLVNPLNTKRVAGAAALTISSTVLQTRFQQELPYGTSYSISFNLQRQQSTQVGLLFNPALTSFFSVAVYQPLLNGFGVALTRRFVTLADNDRQIVREGFRSTLNTTLSNAANAYWDLIARREDVRVAQEAVDAARQLVNDDRERVTVGVMTDLDVLSAESQLAAAQVQLVTAETRRQEQQVLVKAFISKRSDAALDAAVLEATDPLPDASVAEAPPLDSSIADALAHRSLIKQAELSLQNQHIAEEYTRKNLLPTFSIYTSVNMFGLGPAANPAIRQLAHWAYPEYAVGFTWSVPVFNRAAQADDVRARLETQEAEATLQRTKSEIKMQVQTANVGLTRGRAEVAAAKRAVIASQQAVSGEHDKLDAGLSTPYRVMLSQRDLMSAQSAEIQARVNFAKALVAHSVAVGSFLDENGIVADDARRGTLLNGPPKAP